ncbi:MAG: hypothetical protein ACHP7N_16280, partial [Caulobacterales bacterium]
RGPDDTGPSEKPAEPYSRDEIVGNVSDFLGVTAENAGAWPGIEGRSEPRTTRTTRTSRWPDETEACCAPEARDRSSRLFAWFVRFVVIS